MWQLIPRREGTTLVLNSPSLWHLFFSGALSRIKSSRSRNFAFSPSPRIASSPALPTHRASTCHWQLITPRPTLLLQPHSLLSLRAAAQLSTPFLRLKPIRTAPRAPRIMLSSQLWQVPTRVAATSKVLRALRTPLSRMGFPLKSKMEMSWLRKGARSARKPEPACPRTEGLGLKVRNYTAKYMYVPELTV